ncbi:MAG TPA: DUF424 family protein [Candidatus Nanoarchaeia archaeon]|nr:DUF424 family protein [Candidatus Nanoarchaeia archaeon]
MDYIVAKKQSQFGLLVVVTDSDIIGKKFEEERLQLDLTKKFYQGEVKNKEEVKQIMMTARHMHLTGKASVAVGVEMDLVDPKKIIFIDKIPHAEVMNE